MGCHHDTPHPFAFPSARPHYAADRGARAEHLKLEVSLDFERRSISGVATTTFAAARALTHVVFDAEALEIERVLVDGRKAQFDADDRRVTVHLPRALARGQKATVALTYRGTPRRGLYFLGPDEKVKRPEQAWTQGQDEDSRCWFPCLDAPAQKCTTELIATVPRRFSVLSNGALVEDEVHGALRTVHHRLDQPHSPYLVTLVVGRFERHVAKAGATEVHTLFPPGRKADALRCASRTPKMLAFLEGLTGVKYPWGPRYSQVFVTEFIFGGMENTTATTLTDTVLHDARAHADSTAEPLIVHELAHQWFGDLVTCRDWPHGWLNEGFATYCEALWMEEADGLDEADWYRGVLLDAYLSETESYVRPIVERTFDEPIEIFDSHLYEKGALVLHELRQTLGDAEFRAVVHAWLEQHRHQSVETVDLARTVEAVTGRNLDRFFDERVHRSGHAALTVELSFDASAKKLKVQARQTAPTFSVTFPLELHLGNGEVLHHVLELDGPEHLSFVDAPREPRFVCVDPRRHVLGTLKVEQPTAWWRRLLVARVPVRARADAAKALGKDGSALSITALAHVLSDEKAFWGVRGACAKALGQARTPSAKAALLTALSCKHPKARRAVVAALGEYRGDAEVAKALTALCRDGDASVHVEGEAARALGKVRAPRALETLRPMLERPAYADAIQVGALEGLAALQRPEAWPLAVEMSRYGHPVNARRAGLQTAAKLAEVAEKKAQTVDLLADALSDPQFRVVMEALHAAPVLGDERLIPFLESRSYLDGRARRSARDAVRTLREKAGAPKELAALRTEVDALKGEVRALKEKWDLSRPVAKPKGAK
ncbi:MAG: HEAT repeat domain-containing protein [Myxococcaceae bacterium]|nr:HEAT repeat domain-containing protein [Myxococcaceae bacterium]